MIYRLGSVNSKIIDTIVSIYESGGIVVLPTDSVYVFTCSVKSATAPERICRIQGIDIKQAKFSMLFSDFSMMADYVKPFSTFQFKILKRTLPGPYTFIVEASPKIGKIIPTSRKTIGIRIPDHPDALEVIKALGHPVFSSSVHDPEDELTDYLADPAQIENFYGDKVEAIIDGGFGNVYPTTVVELFSGHYNIIRNGLGEAIDLG
ncbi:MAG: L-threonylcarbamoyladenylate synthase [Bacteroidia bacterium]|nr:L-threonylcarbamoyladenylate synthase [Bacteroidia bacterium]